MEEGGKRTHRINVVSYCNQIEHSFLGKSLYEPGLFHTNIRSREDYLVHNDERSKTKFMLAFSMALRFVAHKMTSLGS